MRENTNKPIPDPPTGSGPPPEPRPDLAAKARGYGVHVLTASGVVFAFLAGAEICSPQCDPRWVFVWLALATLVDAVDGPLARRWRVKQMASAIDGRTIDDILDYLTYTFLPLLLIWRMGWLPPLGVNMDASAGLAAGHAGGAAPLLAGVWVAPAMLVSLLGFANVRAKDETQGFFVGFPSYWNIVAFYAGLLALHEWRWINAGIIVTLTVLTLAPVRFVYPNLAPPPWRKPLLIAAALWLALLLASLPWYPRIPCWIIWLSVTLVACYVALSVHLDLADRRRRASHGWRRAR